MWLAEIDGHLSNRLPQFSVYAHTMSLRGISPTKRATALRAALPTFLFLLGGTASVLFAQKPTLNTAPAQKSETAPQEPAASAPTISVEAKLVNIPVIVLDKKGALVQNLTKDSFLLKVDGHDQTIRYFNQDKDLPLTIGLLVDTSQSQRSVLDDERTASIAFLDDMLNDPEGHDKGFIVQFARQTDLLQDVTSSKPKLQQGLKQLDASGSGSAPSFGSGGRGSNDSDSNDRDRDRSRGDRGGTTLYDALFLSSDEIQAKQNGRKAVIILSDGVDRNSKESLARSIEAAQRADTIVYAIYYKGRDNGGSNRDQDHQGGGFPGRRGGMGGGGYPGGGGGYPGGGGQGRPQGGGNESHVDGRKVLQRMADETGGRLFEVKGKETVASIYKEIGEELRAQYRLGYTPDKAASSDGYHKIDLELTPASLKNLYIQRRDGYYMGKE
jgi:VWFA-related protein